MQLSTNTNSKFSLSETTNKKDNTVMLFTKYFAFLYSLSFKSESSLELLGYFIKLKSLQLYHRKKVALVLS